MCLTEKKARKGEDEQSCFDHLLKVKSVCVLPLAAHHRPSAGPPSLCDVA